MLRRVDEKTRAREEREAREVAAAARDRIHRRLRMLGIAVAASAAVVLIAVLVSSGGGAGGTKGGGQAGAPTGGQDVATRFAGIPESGFAVGDPKAGVTLVEFADLQCPYCKQFADRSLPTLVDRYVRTGKLRIEFRNFAIVGPDSEKAGRAVAAAAAQNKAWPFIELWYQNQGQENSGYVTDAFIRRIADGVKGLDAAKVVAASNDPASTSSLGAANTEAQKFGIQSTPSFLIGRTGGPLQPLQETNASDPAQFSQPIDRLLVGT